MAAAQAGGARPRREAEPPGEEAPSGPDASAGGSGNAGSGACPGERGPCSVTGSAAGLRRRPGALARAFCPPRGRVVPSSQRSPGRSSAPSALFLHPSGFLSRRLRPLPGLRAVRSAAPFLPVPSAAAPGGELGRPAGSGSPGRGGLALRLPEVGDPGGGWGVGRALGGRYVLARSTFLPPKSLCPDPPRSSLVLIKRRAVG